MPVKRAGVVGVENNKKQRVYEILKNKIINNELKPQEYLNEQSICLDLGVSKTPVREALQRLEHDRLVTIVPNKGCFVSNISIDRIREVFEIRMILECASARLAASSDTRSQFKSILENHESFKIHSGEETRHYLLSGYQIHTHIVEATGNSYLTDLYQTILNHIVQIRVHFLSRFKENRLHQTVEEHKKILQAIVDGDADEAENTMKDHLKMGLITINQLMLGQRVDL